MRTVAGELERVLSQLFDQPIKVSAAGRTDAGVHALGQVISFSAHAGFPIERLALALNSALPADLSARDAVRTAGGFSARFDALERRYRYVVLNRRDPSAVWRRFAYCEPRALNDERMRRAAAHLVGTHDFSSFCGLLPESGGTVRTLTDLMVEREADFVRFHFRAGGFLHRMVRIITGTLLEVGSGRRAEDEPLAMLAARDRRTAGVTAPPQGLFLVGVRYATFDSGSGAEWPTA